MAAEYVLSDDELQRVYVWVDSIPLSRPKRNIARDMSDGVMVAEIVAHYFPKLVELHNYSAASSIRQKLYNWSTLNSKVFKRLGYEVKRGDVEAIVNCKPGVVEYILMQLQQKIADFRAGRVPTSSPGGSPSTAGRPGTTTATATSGAGGGGAADSPAAPPASRSAGTTSGGAGGDSTLLAEKDATIGELRETIEILELKIKKLEQLVKLKDQRIQTLTARLSGPTTIASGATPYPVPAVASEPYHAVPPA